MDHPNIAKVLDAAAALANLAGPAGSERAKP